MSEIRRFEKTDWSAWAGATKFKNGSEPFIYEDDLGVISVSVIGDAEGICINLSDDESFEYLTWTYNKTLTSIQAMGAMRAVVKQIKKYEDASDICYAIDHATEPEFEGFEFNGAV